MRKEYSTPTLVLLAVIAGPVIQPLAWFYLLPLYSPPVSNFTVYWISYFLWAAFSLVMSVRASGGSVKRPKGAPYVFAFVVCFLAIGVLVGTFPILENVVYSWFEGFMLGFSIAAVLYLLKPSLNVVQSDKREENRRSRLLGLNTGSSEEKILTVIPYTKELKGPNGKIFDLLITDQRIIGIRRSGNLASKNIHAGPEPSTIERLIESNPKENFGVKYEEIQSIKLQKYAFWATGTGRLFTIKFFGGKAQRFVLLDSEDYRELKTNLSGLWRPYMKDGNKELKNSNTVSS